jgi:hypothetical protein
MVQRYAQVAHPLNSPFADYLYFLSDDISFPYQFKIRISSELILPFLKAFNV